ncbi:UNVERIFIED_CONTAM: hypothetical protein PYX00_009115 [Menopon gallinae]|uniref:Uncharacterized protein n=1 Tax=Menopon gallinae TaxID=328185 RepID=A0AAW2HA41_9NEOP
MLSLKTDLPEDRIQVSFTSFFNRYLHRSGTARARKGRVEPRVIYGDRVARGGKTQCKHGKGSFELSKECQISDKKKKKKESKEIR